MFKIRFHLFGKRLWETVIGELIISALFAFFANMIDSQITNAVVLVGCANVFYLIWQYLRLRNYRLKVSKIKNYDKTNLVVMGILCVTAVIFGIAADLSIGKPYFAVIDSANTFLFFVFKVFYYLGQYSGHHICYVASAMIVSIVEIVFIIVLPMFINKKKALLREKQKYSRKHIFD